MVTASRFQLSVPSISFPSYLFTSPTATLPTSTAFYDALNPTTKRLSFPEFRLWAQRLAAGLQAAGIQPGDRILVFAPNSIAFPVAFLGIVMSGAIFSGANPSFVPRELAYQLKDTGATFLLCADESLEVGVEAAKLVGLPQERVFVFDDACFEAPDKVGADRLGCQNWANALLAPEHVGRGFHWKEPENPKEAVMCLNYSSGTTGQPKGVMITHWNYVSNSVQMIYMIELNPKIEELRERASLLCFLPMYHAMAQTVFIANAPKRQVPVGVMKKFDFDVVLQSLEKFKVTALNMVPPIVVALAKSPNTKKYDLSSIVDIGSGAAPLSGDVIAEVEALWPKGSLRLKQGWGMTETTCSILGWDSRVNVDSNSVGELNPNCFAKIVNPETLEEAPPGERGELWVTGPNIMKGYWQNPEATASTLIIDSSSPAPDSPWLRTGDIAYISSEGHFFIVDRMKELIKVKGNQVAPAELEALLIEHPAIADAAVVGVVIGGEEYPRAYLVLKPDQVGKVSGDEVAAWLAERVIRYKRLRGGVVFVDAVPKNPSGKILRKLLRERAKEEVGDKPNRTSKL